MKNRYKQLFHHSQAKILKQINKTKFPEQEQKIKPKWFKLSRRALETILT